MCTYKKASNTFCGNTGRKEGREAGTFLPPLFHHHRHHCRLFVTFITYYTHIQFFDGDEYQCECDVMMVV